MSDDYIPVLELWHRQARACPMNRTPWPWWRATLPLWDVLGVLVIACRVVRGWVGGRC